MKSILRIVWLVSALFWIGASGRVDESEAFEIEVRSQLERNRYRIDEEIVYRITLTWTTKETDIIYRLPDLPLENLELVETSQASGTSHEGAGSVRERILTFKLRPKGVGEARIGKFFIEYQLPTTGESFRREVSPVSLTVVTAGWNPVFLFGLVALMTTGGLLIVLLRRLQSARKPVGSNDQRTEEDTTVLELRDLSRLLEKSEYQKFLLQTGDILRRYLVRKYRLGGGQRSYLEVLTRLGTKQEIPRDEKGLLRDLFRELGEGAFSGSLPGRRDLERLHQRVIEFIEGKRVIQHHTNEFERRA